LRTAPHTGEIRDASASAWIRTRKAVLRTDGCNSLTGSL